MARSKITQSHYKLMTGDMGYLYPFGLVEQLPNTTVQHSASVFMRFSPMSAPIMHPVTVRVHHFFIPMRLLWPDDGQGTGWENFITSGADGTDSQVIPTMDHTPVKGDLTDYLGLPVGQGQLTFSSLPITAFNMIYNEWFRDQDLVAKRDPADLTVPRIAWEKDYFSTARPWAQKGPSVTLPLGGSAPVVTTSNDIAWTGSGPSGEFQLQATAANLNVLTSQQLAGTENMRFGSNTGLEADLTSATATDVLGVREAFALQRYAEARARWGSRYTEYMRAAFGAMPQDARLQRPELLGAGKARVNVSEVLQTANETTPGRFGVGDLYGHGMAAMRSNAYRRTMPEWGYIMSLLSVRPKTIYMNGTHRSWLKRTREEFFQKELQYIGQQEIWNGEVYHEAASSPYDTFGYGDRYAEYRSHPSSVAADFRDQLKFWHLARDFSALPALNQTFVEADVSKRIFNVQTENGLWIAAQHRMVARAPMANNPTPRIL